MNQELSGNKLHTSSDKLAKDIEDAKQLVNVGGIYVHYKSPDKPYKVIAVGLQEATEEPCVIYQAQHGDTITWVRDLSDWTAQVQDNNGLTVPRFKQMAD